MSFWKRLRASLFGAGRGTAPAALVAGAPPAAGAFGTTPDNPILCHDPSGERAYIARLRCAQGHRFSGSRFGSLAGKCSAPAHHISLISAPDENPAEVCIVDGYELVCAGGECSLTLYFDMYHPTTLPQPAPAGTTIV